MSYYISKPFSRLEVLAAIRQYITSIEAFDFSGTCFADGELGDWSFDISLIRPPGAMEFVVTTNESAPPHTHDLYTDEDGVTKVKERYEEKLYSFPIPEEEEDNVFLEIVEETVGWDEDPQDNGDILQKKVLETMINFGFEALENDFNTKLELRIHTDGEGYFLNFYIIKTTYNKEEEITENHLLNYLVTPLAKVGFTKDH